MTMSKSNLAKTYISTQPFTLEAGDKLERIEIAYHTYGHFRPGISKVIWICHALTANSDVSDWWSSLFGEGNLLDPKKYFIVCANNLGSCYGSTSPISINPTTNNPFGRDFPFITIRDMVESHRLLMAYLGIGDLFLLMGGSQGGQQCLEWAITYPEEMENMVVLATNARHSAWGVAFNEAQRLALKAGEEGLVAARAIAMLSYRNYEMYERTELPEDFIKLDGFGAAGYQQYQGQKLAKRFDADSYYTLSKAMDSHNVGRGRGSIPSALSKIKADTLIIGITSDLLFPIHEQELLAKYIPNANLELINSPYGHDGFLTEGERIRKIILDYLY